MEDGRKVCAKYWPEPGQFYRWGDAQSEDGIMTVTTDDAFQSYAYIKRIIKMEMSELFANHQSAKQRKMVNTAQETRQITHFQFTIWPENGSNPSAASFTAFFFQVRQAIEANDAMQKAENANVLE